VSGTSFVSFETGEGHLVEYRFALWVALIPPALAVIALVVGLAFLARRTSRGVGLAVSGFAIVFGVIFGPLLLLDRVTVTSERIEQCTGFWFIPTRKGFDYADVTGVVIHTARGHRGRSIEVWTVTDRHGGRRTIDPGDLWVLYSDEIRAQLAEHGVRVVRR
jgi:hypothetical protein